ncbi:MAG TPA: hypothetical protein EYH02_04960 [Ignisphaera aggregans]|uniref:Uncharacterized protein n=1 Tax=Ignisphaera aggregans TaxID=334771 RepID=A0A833DV10_9CREN|nr:hypothetical protein [Ignisphaera aggregans]
MHEEISEAELEKLVLEIIGTSALSFDELRERIEDRGVYLDGRVLRRVVAELVRRGVLCKTPFPERRKLLLHLCTPSRNT